MKEKPKILVVDDRLENIFALKETLAKVEAEFITATSGNEALKQVLNHDFALALIDAQMPVMDGYELAAIIRSEKKSQQIPIIFISAIYSDDYHLFKGYDAGAVDFLIKPYNPFILVNKCKVFLELYRQRRKIETSKEYIDRILASMHEALMVTDSEGVIEKINSATTKLLGFNEDGLLGKSIRLIFKEAGEDIFRKGERTLVDHNGRHIPVLFSNSIIEDENNGIRGIVCVATDISDHKQAEKKIKASLEEKELLLRELYHRTKNNMQVIGSLINLQAEFIEDKQVLKIFKEIENRIKSMALVHKNLYQSKNLSKINLKSYIEDLAQGLLNSYKVTSKKISLKIIARHTVYVSIDAAIPCGLVVNEIISNSLQHAFPGNREGEISIRLLTMDEGEHEIRIADNGIGVSKDFDLKKVNSLGLQIVTLLTEKQLQGKVKVIPDQGLEFRIRFKEPCRSPRIIKMPG